jgi:hypothetical protein
VIVDLHPKAGETGMYPPASEAGGEDADYAIIVLMRGLDRLSPDTDSCGPFDHQHSRLPSILLAIRHLSR